MPRASTAYNAVSRQLQHLYIERAILWCYRPQLRHLHGHIKHATWLITDYLKEWVRMITTQRSIETFLCSDGCENFLSLRLTCAFIRYLSYEPCTPKQGGVPLPPMSRARPALSDNVGTGEYFPIVSVAVHCRVSPNNLAGHPLLALSAHLTVTVS